LPMIQEWKNVEFQFGHDPQAKYDLVVCDFGSRMTVMHVLDEHENTGTLAKTKAQDEMKKIKKDDDSPEVKSFSVSYEGEGAMTALIFCGQPSAFVSQTALRKAIVKKITPAEEDFSVNVNLRGLKDVHAKEIMGWIASLAHIVRYRPEVYGKKKTEQKPQGKLTVFFETGLNKKVCIDAIKEGQILGFCNNQVKYLADLPSNVLNPTAYREFVQKMVKELNEAGAQIESSFLDKKQLQKRGAGAFLAVAKADHHDRAGIIHLRYAGTSKSKKKLAIVGKGLCFDTGGYNIKTGDYMYNMHRDMTGSAVALSLFRAMVEMEVPYEVNAYLALAENLISHEGYRPNDIVVASNGISIEVIDTDAEGRMVLSDTLVLASEKEPDMIIDFATLTGSVVRALDTRRCGAYSNQPKFAELAVKVGDECGERVWNFPISDDYEESLKSPYADVRQCASSNAADHIYAATFLSKFVGKVGKKSIPWLHVDLAADTNKGGLGLVPHETTGFGVRFGYSLSREYLG
jgi:leucyl aminopeptidase